MDYVVEGPPTTSEIYIFQIFLTSMYKLHHKYFECRPGFNSYNTLRGCLFQPLNNSDV